MTRPLPGETIDIHTHSTRREGFFVMNVFAQDLAYGLPDAANCTIGLHPWHLEQTDTVKCLQNLVSFAGNEKVIAIGETGLDRKISVPVDLQMEVFMAQLDMAEKAGKPVVIHCVKAYSDIIAIRKSRKWNMPWMIHWFNANLQIAEDLIHTGCLLSFGRSLLHPNGKNAEVFRQVPLEAVFLETDDAEITIESVYQKAAFLKNIPVDQLIIRIAENFDRVYLKK